MHLRQMVVWFWAWTFILVSSLHAAETPQSSVFEPPSGTIPLLPAGGQRLRVALVGLFSPSLSKDMSDGWLALLEHELLFRPGYEGKYDVITQDDQKALLRKDFAVEHFDPLWTPRIKDALAADYLVFLDERLKNKDRVWKLRVYNGRSGAFLADEDIPYLDYHLRWTADLVLQRLHQIIYPGAEKKPVGGPPSEMLLARSVELAAGLKAACLEDHCIEKIKDFEWLRSHNRDFFDQFMRNTLFLNKLEKQAETPLLQARVSLLAGNPMDSFLRLESKLDGAKIKEKIEYLRVLGRAAVELDRPEKAEEIYQSLQKTGWRGMGVLLGQAWVDVRKRRCPEALRKLETLLARKPYHQRGLELLQQCYTELRQEDKSWETKERLAKALSRKEHWIKANPLWMELLDHEFNMEWLARINIPLLSPLDRKNLATMLNQQGIQHDKNEGEIFRFLAEIKLFEGQYDEAVRVINGALQIDPENLKLIALAVSDGVLRRGDLVGAQNLITKIPYLMQDPYVRAALEEKLNHHELAEKLWAEGHWPEAWKAELMVRRAGLLDREGKTQEALALVEKALSIYSGREDFHQAAKSLYKKIGKPDLTTAAELNVLQLSGQPLDIAKVKDHLFNQQYGQLILPHALVGLSPKKQLIPLGRVIVLDGTPLPPDTWWAKWLPYVQPYVLRDPGRGARELEQVLTERYHLVDNEIMEQEFRSKLRVDSSNPARRFTMAEIIDFAKATGVDSIFVVDVNYDTEMKEEFVQAKVNLYFFNGTTNTVSQTDAKVSLGYFELFRFNPTLMLAPVLLVLILLYVFSRFSRMTKHWSDPLLKAEYLVKQKNFRKAGDVLGRYGYFEDQLEVMGHHYLRQKDYAKALEAFFRAKDYGNAVAVLKICPETAEVNNLAAEMFFQLKDYDRAEVYFRKNRNLIGMAKVFEAVGDKRKAGRIMGQYYFEANNPIGAIEEYRKIGDFDRAGLVLFHYQKYEEAAVMFQQSGNDKMVHKCMMRLGKRPA